MDTCDSKSPQAEEETLNHLGIKVVVLLIHGYRMVLSPWIGNQCRFHPTCSHYAETAVKRFGFAKGLGLTIWRILRCQPFAKGGFDPVPKKH